uniref:Spectrin repeat containing nuclear envelope family member 3 n=1 Tax=Erpetoichthys calabaricus TaxID=27687 RepID=A0A8C4TFC6_ERPCA
MLPLSLKSEAMTQHVEEEFGQSLENAKAWMQAVQERLRVNDNTRGPKEQLEARLRQTKEIYESEIEGMMKMEIVYKAGKELQEIGNEDKRHETICKLKNIKEHWEETRTYIIHCHSRIEWVWLHWNEYLKAYEEFSLWLAKMNLELEPNLQLQLGLKEKCWQLDHHHILLKVIHNHSDVLNRLLDEAACLHSITEDASMNDEVQKKLEASYEDINSKAQERVLLLQKIVEEHKSYQQRVEKFQNWILSKADEVNKCFEMKGRMDEKLMRLQHVLGSINNEEKTLQDIERMAAAVKENTSPLGAERISKRLEELRISWEELRRLCKIEKGRLEAVVQCESENTKKVSKLKLDTAAFRKRVQKLNDGLQVSDQERTQEEMIILLQKMLQIRGNIADEESTAERLKAQLKEVFQFSQDVQVQSDVLAAVKEYQSVKRRAFTLYAEMETSLWWLFQVPLRDFLHWKSAVLTTLSVPEDQTSFIEHLKQVKFLVQQSFHLKDRLRFLSEKQDLLSSIFDKNDVESLRLHTDRTLKEREELHARLLQCKDHLETSASKAQDFKLMFKSIQKSLSTFKDRIASEGNLQPDILTKKAQKERLQVIHKDLIDFEPNILKMQSFVSEYPSYKYQFAQLLAEWKTLNNSLQKSLQECEKSVNDHEHFRERLLSLQQWMMIIQQKLEPYKSVNGDRSTENREAELEKILSEFPEKEMYLHETDVLGLSVQENTSAEGQVHIQRDLKELKQSWASLQALILHINSLITKLRVEEKIQNEGKVDLRHLLQQRLQISMQVSDVASLGSDSKNTLSNEDICSEQISLEGTPGVEIGVSSSTSNTSTGGRDQTVPDVVDGPFLNKQKLQSEVPEGQNLFQSLLNAKGPEIGEDTHLEGLRYKWMLYKSKLKSSANLKSVTLTQVENRIDTGKKRSGFCPFLYRVCCAALPLQLLLLSLLLLAFLLPLVDEGSSCSLANNFARSFNLMLRYDGPPPT